MNIENIESLFSDEIKNDLKVVSTEKELNKIEDVLKKYNSMKNKDNEFIINHILDKIQKRINFLKTNVINFSVPNKKLVELFRKKQDIGNEIKALNRKSNKINFKNEDVKSNLESCLCDLELQLFNIKVLYGELKEEAILARKMIESEGVILSEQFEEMIDSINNEKRELKENESLFFNFYEHLVTAINDETSDVKTDQENKIEQINKSLSLNEDKYQETEVEIKTILDSAIKIQDDALKNHEKFLTVTIHEEEFSVNQLSDLYGKIESQGMKIIRYEKFTKKSKRKVVNHFEVLESEPEGKLTNSYGSFLISLPNDRSAKDIQTKMLEKLGLEHYIKERSNKVRLIMNASPKVSHITSLLLLNK